MKFECRGWKTLVVVLGASVLGACSSGGGKGNGDAGAGPDVGEHNPHHDAAPDRFFPADAGPTSGLMGTLSLHGLGTDDLTTLCRWSTDRAAGAATADCPVRAVSAAAHAGATTDKELQDACANALAACVSTAQTSTVVCQLPPASCTATVSEFETCADEDEAALAAYATKLPACGALTLAFLSQADAAPAAYERPASCATFTAKCGSYVPGSVDQVSSCSLYGEKLCAKLNACGGAAGDAGADAAVDLDAAAAVDDAAPALTPATAMARCLAPFAGAHACENAAAVSASFDVCLSDLAAISCEDLATADPASCAGVVLYP